MITLLASKAPTMERPMDYQIRTIHQTYKALGATQIFTNPDTLTPEFFEARRALIKCFCAYSELVEKYPLPERQRGIDVA